MSGIGGLDTWDKMTLRDSIDIALYKTIEHFRDIEKIAERFCNGDTAEAFSDIIEKGLQEYLDMCDMDEHVCQIEEDYTAVPFTDTEVKAWEDAHKEGKE